MVGCPPELVDGLEPLSQQTAIRRVLEKLDLHRSPASSFCSGQGPRHVEPASPVPCWTRTWSPRYIQPHFCCQQAANPRCDFCLHPLCWDDSERARTLATRRRGIFRWRTGRRTRRGASRSREGLDGRGRGRAEVRQAILFPNFKEGRSRRGRERRGLLKTAASNRLLKVRVS